MSDSTITGPASSATRTVAPSGPAVGSAAFAPGFDLLEEIGRGGMGVVWRARDLALQRDVAVKVLADRYAPGSPVASRFLDEARITSQLQHPGIPAIYQISATEQGQPCLAMKLIKGRTLEAMLKAGESIPVLAVFESICQAVGFAHSRGVIHRDLKPANVMVGAFAEVQVMDWGLAKLLAQRTPDERGGAEVTEIVSGRDGETSIGSVLGTPAYIPPEQAAGSTGQVGKPSDVFGLGAILCVLLTGTPPFAGREVESVRRNAARGHMPEAEAKLAACAAEPEVVALCRRCLSFEPDDRYPDAIAVAAEVTRIRAASAERAQRAEVARQRADVRRRVMTWSAAVVAAVLLAGVVGTGIGLRNAWQANEEAEAARRAADERAAAEAEARKHEAEERAYAQAIADFVKYDFLALTSVEGQSRFGGAGLTKDATLRDLLLRAAQKLDGRGDLAPRIEAELKWMIGVSLRGAGDVRAAIPHLERAETLARQHEPKFLSTVQNSLAVAYGESGQRAKARAIHESLLKERTETLGPDHAETLSSMHNLAVNLHELGEKEQALRLFEKTFVRREATRGPDHRETLMAQCDFAAALHEAGRRSESMPLKEDLLRRCRAAFGEDDLATLDAMNSLAVSYRALGRVPEALVLYRAAWEGRKRRLGADHPDTLTSLNNLAFGHRSAGRLDLAAPLFEEARDQLRKRVGAEHPNAIAAVGNVASVYLAAGRLDDAERELAIFLDASRRQFRDDPLQFTGILRGVAADLVKVRRYAIAVRCLRECLDIIVARKPESFARYQVASLLGEALAKAGQHLEAESLLLTGHAGIQTLRSQIPPGTNWLREAGQRLVDFYTMTNQPAKAEEWRRKLPREFAPRPRTQ